MLKASIESRLIPGMIYALKVTINGTILVYISSLTSDRNVAKQDWKRSRESDILPFGRGQNLDVTLTVSLFFLIKIKNRSRSNHL